MNIFKRKTEPSLGR